MKLIIDIPDGMYNSIIENGKGTIMQLKTELYGVLCRATPLPKEHEDLKDKRDTRFWAKNVLRERPTNIRTPSVLNSRSCFKSI